MLQDFNTCDDQAEFYTDICIIGAGAAGIAIAREFLQSSKDVILVESGGLNAAPSTDALNQGESVGLPYTAFSSQGRSRLLGGTTQLWYGQCVPLDAIDFDHRPWVPESGWPFSKTTLDPYYRRAEHFFGIPDAIYDERVWQKFRIQPPPLDNSKLRYKPTVWCPQPHIGKLYRDQLVKARNIKILLNANVTRIHSNESHSIVDFLDIRSLSSIRGKITAKAYILCCGGIENARLLLLSDGLGNDYDIVGRYFQEHIHACCGIVDTDNPLPFQDTLAMLYKHRFRYLPKLSLSEEIQRQQQTLNCTANLVFQFNGNSAASASRTLYLALKRRQRPNNLRELVTTVGYDAKGLLSLLYRRYVLGRSSAEHPIKIWLQPHIEQAPNPNSRITLSYQRDQLGLPIPKVDWRLGELERHTAETMVRTLQADWGNRQLAQIQPVNWLIDKQTDWQSQFGTSCHPMGATRMADNARVGVVDRHCKVHGVANLFIAGSSV